MGNGKAPPWTPAAGELVAERFDLEREIARGGMGSIWRAHHVRLDTPVAVKFIDGSLVDSDFLRDRFQREARAAARLRSRHVVQILDYGVWRKIPYIAMELLEGETMADRLERTCRLEPAETLSLVKGVVRALSKAAELDIVHRDLKPENLFIVRERGHEYVKVLDFGVAKLRDPNLLDSNGHTKTGVVVGTPYYMSPEQSDGTRNVDHRSDLWSLAVIVFECLTGELPFYSEAFGNLVLKINSGPIPVPSDVRDGLPKAFDDWWARASRRDPTERFQTADALFEALYDALIDPRQSLSSYPFLVNGPAGRDVLDEVGAAYTPKSVRFDSLAPAPHDASRSDEPEAPAASGGLTWSGPNSSARPRASLPPADLGPDSTPPQLGEPRPSHRGTFGGHASSRPPVEGTPLRRRRAMAAVLGIGVAAAAAVGWITVRSEGTPSVVQAGALLPPEDLQPSALATQGMPPAPKSDDAEADDRTDRGSAKGQQPTGKRDEVAPISPPAPPPKASAPKSAPTGGPRPHPTAPPPTPATDQADERFPAGI